MQSETAMKFSPLDLMTAILTGKVGDGVPPEAAVIAENRQLLMILTTSIAVLIGCAVVFVWRRSSGKSSKSVEPPRPLVLPKEAELDVDDGKKKVTIFFGTQTGTAEGFAKVRGFDQSPARFL